MTKLYRFEVAAYIAVEADSTSEAVREAARLVGRMTASAPTGVRIGLARRKRT